MTAGKRQGDPISPDTFIAFLERIVDGINEMEDKGVIIQGLPIYNLKFADDVDLIDKDLTIYRRCQTNSVRTVKDLMCINKDKTKATTFRRSVQSDEFTL